jgi:hypothetical protein
MKKLFTILIFLCAAVTCFAQYPNNQNTGSDSTLQILKAAVKSRFVNVFFTDTTQANTQRIKQYPYAMIAAGNNLWLRDSTATRWILQATNINIDSLIINLIDSSTNTVTIINDSTLLICNVAGSCDTVNFTSSVTNITTAQFITDSSVQVCSFDTANGSVIQLCDTIITGPQPIVYLFQNGLFQNASHIVEFGTNPLLHNTTLDTRSFIQTFTGATVYNYPYQFSQAQAFQSGTGMVSFLSRGSGSGAIDFHNTVRLGVNYTGDVYVPSPHFSGYMGDKIGYWIGANATGNGSFGIYTDNSSSKLDGIFFHTLDTAYTDAITFFGKHPPNVNNTISIQPGHTGLENYRIATLHDNKNITFYGYPNTRNDGTIATKALSTDASGNVILVPISAISNDSCGLFSGGRVSSADSSTSTGYIVLDVSAADYALCCDLVRRSTATDTVHLQHSDPDNPRYDAVILTANGDSVLTGVAAANPSFPQISNCQILLTYVRVNAGDTVPSNVNIVTIYDQDDSSEFYPTAVGVTTDFASTAHPAHLTIAADVGAFTQDQYLLFTDTVSTWILTNYNLLKFYVRLKSTGLTSFSIAWYLDNVQATGWLTVANGQYGFNNTLLNQYQIITIPVPDFPIYTTSINQVKFSLNGSGSGFYADWIQLQNGFLPPPPTGGQSIAGAGNILFDFTVDNPNGNAFLNHPLLAQCSYCAFVNNSNVSAVPTFDFINLAHGITDTLALSHIRPGNNGDVLTTTGGNVTWVAQSTGYDTTVVRFPLIALPGTVRDTIIFNLYAGTNITIDSLPGDGIRINSTGGGATAFNGLSNAVTGTDSVRLGGTLNQNTTITGANNYLAISGGRFEEGAGANVAAANNLTVGNDGNVFTITGNTQINAITTTNWQAGSQIDLIFTGTPTVKNNTAGGAGTAKILLAGSTDFVAAANDVLTLVYDGTSWHESARKTSAAQAITLNNGLTLTGTNGQLGGTLIQNTTITAGAFRLSLISGTNTNGVLVVSGFSTFSQGVINATNTGNGYGIKASSASVEAVYGTTPGNAGALHGVATSASVGTGGIGVLGEANVGIGVQGVSNDSSAFEGEINPSSTNTVKTAMNLSRFSNGGGASAGIGLSVDFSLITNSGSDVVISNQIISKWTDAVRATRTSQFSITGVNSGTTQTLQTLDGNGQLTLNQYTAGNFEGGAAADSVLVITSAGVVKKRDAASFGGGGGGTPFLPVTGIGTATGNVTGDLAGNTVIVAQDGVEFLSLIPTPLNENAILQAYDTTDNDNSARITAHTSNTQADFDLLANFNDLTKFARLQLNADASTSSTTFTADTHKFTGNVGIGVTPTVLFQVGTASLLSIDDVGFASSIAATGNGGGAGASFYSQIGNFHFEFGANNGSDPDVSIYGDANAQTMTLTSASTIISNLAGTGSRAVLADATGTLSAPVSDISVKENIEPLANGLETIMQLKPVSFYFKDGWKNYGAGQQVGFIAQDIAQVLPGSVFTTPKTGKMGYNETDIIPILVKAMQQQEMEIQALQRQINQMKNEK